MGNTTKVAVVTGVTKGIGMAIASIFAQKGFNIVGIARNQKDLDEVLGKLQQSFGVACLGLTVDVSRGQEVDQILPKTLEKFNRVDVLVNNAAVGKFDYLINSSEEDWDNMIDINLKGVYLCSKAILGQMIKQRRGVIINISSVCGLGGVSRYGIYCASKFGVIGLTETLAKELKEHDITVSAVCPSIVDTGFASGANQNYTDSNNMLKPETVAQLVFDLTKAGTNSQICEIHLGSITPLQRLLRIDKRPVVIKRVKYL